MKKAFTYFVLFGALAFTTSLQAAVIKADIEYNNYSHHQTATGADGTDQVLVDELYQIAPVFDTIDYHVPFEQAMTDGVTMRVSDSVRSRNRDLNLTVSNFIANGVFYDALFAQSGISPEIAEADHGQAGFNATSRFFKESLLVRDYISLDKFIIGLGVWFEGDVKYEVEFNYQAIANIRLLDKLGEENSELLDMQQVWNTLLVNQGKDHDNQIHSYSESLIYSVYQYDAFTDDYLGHVSGTVSYSGSMNYMVVTEVPEPTGLALVLIGLTCLPWRRRNT